MTFNSNPSLRLLRGESIATTTRRYRLQERERERGCYTQERTIIVRDGERERATTRMTPLFPFQSFSSSAILGGAVDVCAVELPFEKMDVRLGRLVEVVERGGEPREGRSNRGAKGEVCPSPVGEVGGCFEAEDVVVGDPPCDDSLSKNSIQRFEKDCHTTVSFARNR